MQSVKVNEFLKNYKEYDARCKYLEANIEQTKNMLYKAKQNLVDESVNVTQKLSGMPHGTGTGDPTGQLGIRMASGFLPPYISELELEIKEMKAELEAKSIVVHFVNAWLQALNPKELFIIEHQTIGGMYWREIIFAYKAAFGDTYSKDGLKRIRDAALEKIYKVAE